MYYLPIYVNNRRMHVVKMKRVDDNNSEIVLFSFLVNSYDNYEVFSLPAENVQLICDSGSNINLSNSNFLLSKAEKGTLNYKHSENIPVYNIDIINDEKERGGKVDNQIINDGLFFNGVIGNTINNDPFALQKEYNQRSLGEYILQFTYNNKGQIYVGAIRICEFNGEENDLVLRAALDFGSEASQVSRSTDMEDRNMNIRDAFIRMLGCDTSKDYWQGRNNDDNELYKSTYFINKNPKETNFGEITKNDSSSFLRCLMPIDTPGEELKKYYLLPNLKLIEKLNNVIENRTVNFTGKGFMGGAKEVDLTNSKLHEGILRQILCNFLAVIMFSENDRPYVKFTLLVPNVYSQEKVHKLVEGLYDDFNILRNSEYNNDKFKRFNKYKGIEINIVSESDASFFGIINKVQEDSDYDFRPIYGAHYMVIDAGKGTTDFSLIVQEGDGLSNYNSIYRSGIPASGHFLTYAIYEAIRDYYYERGYCKRFNEIINKALKDETASSKDVLEFVSCLEEFKAKYNSLKEEESECMKLNEKVNSLQSLNVILKTVLNNKKTFPGVTKSLNGRIAQMTDLLKNSIMKYTKNSGIVCENVFLTGRAFKLEPFRKEIIKALVEYNVVKDSKDVIFNDDYTKKICTVGALKIAHQGVVNKGSNALGVPHLKEEYGDGKRISKDGDKKWTDIFTKRFWRRLTGHAYGKEASMSYDFFYQGLSLSNVRNATFTLCGAGKLIGSGVKDDLYVYYVGDGYIHKHGNLYSRIDISRTSNVLLGDIMKEILNGSIFPFNIKSFNLSEYEVNPNNQSSVQKEESSQEDDCEQ